MAWPNESRKYIRLAIVFRTKKNKSGKILFVNKRRVLSFVFSLVVMIGVDHGTMQPIQLTDPDESFQVGHRH